MVAVKTIRSLERGFKVLEALNRRHGASAQELARSVNVPRPTVYRLLETMRKLGYVIRSETDEHWHLTAQIKSLSAGFHDDVWVTRIAAPLLHDLGRKVLWPVDLITYENGAMVIRETTHAESPFSIDRGMAGTRLPMLETSGGRAFLAFSPKAEREVVLQELRRSAEPHDQMARDRDYVQRLLGGVRRAGYASRGEGFNPHTSSISVPVIVDDRVKACISMIWIKKAMKIDEAVRQFLEPIRQTAGRIAGEMSATAEPLRR
jgi:IclR family transcriptional regulator, mhp operon transcriptional activator